MIVCKRCGNHNPAGDDFCGSCGAYLEWEGEAIVTDVPEQPPDQLPAPTGLVTRIKQAVLGDATLPPPSTPSVDQPSTPTSETPPASTSGSTPPPTAAGGGVDEQAAIAAALVAKPRPPEPQRPRQPAAQVPSAAVARPKPQAKQPPTRTVKPGDLVCGACGEPNSSERNFCRRCGTSLAEVVAVKKPWWKRGGGRSAAKSAPTPAGERPMGRGAGGEGFGKGAKRKGRRVKAGVFGGFANVRRVLALLAIIGIGTGLAVPGLRSTIMNGGGDALDFVKRKVNPDFEQVSPDNAATFASSAVPGHEATLIADGANNTHWVAAPDATEVSATVMFAPPTKLAAVLITPGDQDKPENFKVQPRPKDVFVEALDANGASLKSMQITLEDIADPQRFDFSASDVVFVRISVQSCYPSPELRVCAITEIEFFKKQ